MRISIAQQLRSLNYKFYINHANDFAKTRNYIQPGITKAIKKLLPYTNLLDVGCGNGRVLKLAHAINKDCNYTGIDFSPMMMNSAPNLPNATFICFDITSPNWTDVFKKQFDSIVCFSVLHHIPGQNNRIDIISNMYSTLKPGGYCAISVWQFLQTERLRKKIVPWKRIGLTKEQVDYNDYLVDWKGGKYGIRYVHHFSIDSLKKICQGTGFQIKDVFLNDGKKANLGLYTILQKPS